MISLDGITEVAEHQAVSASAYNALVRAVRGLVEAMQGNGGGVGGGGGGLGGGGGGGLSEADAAVVAERVRVDGLGRAVLHPARIVSVSADPNVPVYPSDVLYTVKITGTGRVLTNISPALGRPVKGDEAKIYCAAAGTPCMIMRWPGGDDLPMSGALMLLPGSERVWRQPCPETPAPGSSPPLLTDEELDLPEIEKLKLIETRRALRNLGVGAEGVMLGMEAVSGGGVGGGGSGGLGGSGGGGGESGSGSA